MPDVYGPFDGQSWTQAQWYRDAPAWSPSGVFGPPAATVGAGDLPLTVNGLTVSIGLGRAHVRGSGYERTGTVWSATVPANTNATQARIDRLVLRRDLAAKTVGPVLVQGNPAGSPTAPTLQATENGAWDLPLFRFTVPPASGTTLGAVTDDRPWIDPNGGGTLATCTVNGGWSAWGGRVPLVYSTAPFQAKLEGGWINGGAFTIAANSQYPITLPAGWWPRQEKVLIVTTAFSTTPGQMVTTLLTDGRLRLDSYISGPQPTPANTLFFLDPTPVFHLTSLGTGSAYA